MNPRVSRSMSLYRRALELIPGGTQLVSRRPTRYANGVSPAYADRAKGAAASAAAIARRASLWAIPRTAP